MAFALANKISKSSVEYFQHFSKSKWHQYEKARFLMWGDFQTKYSLAILNRSQVIDLLGAPNRERNNIYYYEMGRKFPDVYTLAIEFEKEKVEKYWVEQM